MNSKRNICWECFFKNQRELSEDDLRSLISVNIQTVLTKCMQKHKNQGTLLLNYIKVRRKGERSGCWPLCPTTHAPPAHLKTGPLMWHLGAAVAHALAYDSPGVILQDNISSRLEITADRERR